MLFCALNTRRWIILGAATKGTCSKTLMMVGATVVSSKPKEVSWKQIRVGSAPLAFYLLSTLLKIVLTEIREGLLNAVFPLQGFP